MSAQQQENIRIDGEDLHMSSCPSLPIEEGLVIKCGELDGWSSALTRGYLGSWEIKDGKFYLLKIEWPSFEIKDGKPHPIKT